MTLPRPSVIVVERDWPDDEDVARAVDRIAAALRADMGALVAAVLGGIEREVPIYSRLGNDVVGETSEGVRQIVTIFITALIDRRTPAPEEIDNIAALGSVRRAQGVNAEEMRAAARSALRVSWAYILDVAATLPDASQCATLGWLGAEVFDFSERALAALLRGAGQYERDGPFADAVVRREFAEHLLVRGFGDDCEATARARALGIDLGQPLVVLQVCSASAEDETVDPLHRRIEAIAREFPVLFNGMIRSEPFVHGVILVPVDHAEEALSRVETRAIEDSLLVLASRPTVGARALKNSYERGRSFLAVARVAHCPPGIVDPARYAVQRLLSMSDPRIIRDFVNESLGPVLSLTPGKRSRLLEVIDATLWSQDEQSAADRLGCHRKTVTSRLREAGRVTQLDPMYTDDELTLHVGLLLYQLSGSPDTWDGGGPR